MRNIIESDAGHRRVLIIGVRGQLSRSLTRLLRSEAEVGGIDKTVEPDQALTAIIHAQADVVLVDMPKPDRTWINLIRHVKAANREIKVMAVCGEANGINANRLLRAGADGFISGREGVDEMIVAIQDVLSGSLHVSEEILAAPPATAIRKAKTRRGSDSQKAIQKCRNFISNLDYDHQYGIMAGVI